MARAMAQVLYRGSYIFRKRQSVSRFNSYIGHVRSISSGTPHSTRGTVSTGGTSVHNISFPSRLIALLSVGQEGVTGRREGVGDVDGRDRTAARTHLLEALKSTESHLLSSEKAVSILCQHYQGLRDDMEQRLALISVLASDLGVNHSAIQNSASELLQLHSQARAEATVLKSEAHLHQVLTPFYTELFTHISRTEGGIRFLVDLRADIIEQLKSAGDSTYILSEMSSHLRNLLKQWFSTGLLDIQQLTWESPCDIMEKVSAYEAVHRLRHWQDLKHRVSRHRRCFVFTHRSLPREPLVVLHVALTSEPSSNIQTVLNRAARGDEDLSSVTTAVFYSISATQKGLSGIDLGYFIIRRVVGELQKEFPGQLTTFVTLSPIPGFRRWLDARVRQTLSSADQIPLLSEREGVMEDLQHLFPDAGSSTHALQMALERRDWAVDREGPLATALKRPLSMLCANYLVHEKRRGKALDPVAHFHLSGGASVWRLNWLADISPLGLQYSYGVMCNYGYTLTDLYVNSDGYRATGTIAMSDSVQRLLGQQD